MVSKIVVLSLFISMACAATWIGKVPPKPAEFANKEGCYIKDVNDVFPFGTTITPVGECVRIHCSRTMVDYASCGVVGTDDPKCHVTDLDLSKPYPHCCPTVMCDIDNSI